MNYLSINMFLLLLVQAIFMVIIVSSDECTDSLVEIWDNMTTYDPALSQLTLDMSRGQLGDCEFPIYMDVLAVRKKDSRRCSTRSSYADKWSPWNDIPIGNISSKIVLQFISGKFIFRIKKHKLKKRLKDKGAVSCTPMKKYNNTNNDDIIDNILKDACQNDTGSGAPECRDGALFLHTFNLPPCYIQTDYSRIDVYLYEVNDNKDCQAIKNWEDFNRRFEANSTNVTSHTNLRSLEFEMEKAGNYCFFLSMKNTYPRCSPIEVGHQDKCFFNFPAKNLTPIACQPKLEKVYNSINPFIISVAVCVPILLGITSMVIWSKLKSTKSNKYRYLLRSFSTQNSVSTIDDQEEEVPSNNLKQIFRLVLLYFPGEFKDEHRDAILGENGALGRYGEGNREIIVTDVCQQIEQDVIQNPGRIESDLSNGRTRCILVLSPGIKHMFDYVVGGTEVDPLVNMDGAWRSILPPLVRHLMDMRNEGDDMYGKVACVRFDDQDRNEGDDVQINPNKRFSLPSDADDLSLWTQCK